MQNASEVGMMVKKQARKPIEEAIPSIEKVCVVCLIIIFLVALVLCVLASLGHAIEDSQFWFGILGSIISAVIGYLLGANSKR